MQAVMDSASMAIAAAAMGSSSSGSSSSSSSSGYGSATTTPTTPLTGGHYETSSGGGGGGGGNSSSSSNNSSNSTSIPMATIATVAPFYSEALTTQQQQQQHHQQQQQQHHQHQQQQQHQHQQQQQQQQQLQSTQSHFYNQNYTGYGSAMSMDPYNYNMVSYNGSAGYNPTSGGLGLPQGYQSISSMGQRYEKLTNKYTANSGIGGNVGKPQAAATPFYGGVASSVVGGGSTGNGESMAGNQYLPPPTNSYIDPYKYKMPTQTNPNLNPTIQQSYMQQYQNPNQKLTSLEPNYAAIKPTRSYQNMPGAPGSTNGSSLGGVGAGQTQYYDKYAMSMPMPMSMPMSMYPANSQLYNPPPPEMKSANNCHNWGSSQTVNQSTAVASVPSVPTAVAPTGSTYHHSTNDIYYNKYDKYQHGSSNNPYQTVPGRSMWPDSSSSRTQLSCCSQQPQQSCYYQRNNVNVNYGGAQYGGPSNMKLKHPTDLYVSHHTTPYDNYPANNMTGQRGYVTAPPQLNLGMNMGMGMGMNMNMGMNMGMNMSMGMGMNMNMDGYNDLNLNSLDSGYGPPPSSSLAPPPPTQNQQTNHRPAIAPPPSYHTQSQLSYGKRSTTNSTNCYMTGGNVPHLTNLETHVDSYIGYDLHAKQPVAVAVAPQSTTSSAPVHTSVSSNIRDFLSTWNDGEEDEPVAPLATGAGAAAAVAIVAPNPNISITTSTSPHFMYETLPPAGPTATAVMNLPDIIIDIEKSSNNPNTTGQLEDSFTSFDVEKELDELRLKTSQQPPNDNCNTNETLAEILGEPSVKEPEPVESPSSNLNLPTLTLPLSSPILSNDFPTEDNSNESTFAKEYETFIHKIGGNETTDITPNESTVTDGEEAKRFKFYKRKKLDDNEKESVIEAMVTTVPDAVPDAVPVQLPSTSPYRPKTNRKLLTRRRHRNRMKMLKILEFESPKVKHRYYFKTLKWLRRVHALSKSREHRLILMRRQISFRKERRLPLIKRHSIKEQHAVTLTHNPPTLKGLSVIALNTKAFRSTLMAVQDNRETVIKSGYKIQTALNPTRPDQLEQLSSNSLESMETVESVVLQGNFMGFDDLENTNLTPQAKLQSDETEIEKKKQTEDLAEKLREKLTAVLKKEKKEEEDEEEVAKEMQVQKWLRHNNNIGLVVKGDKEKITNTQPATYVAPSSTSSSSSSSSTSSSSSSTSSSTNSSTSSSSSSSTSSSDDEDDNVDGKETFKDLPSKSSSSSSSSSSDDESDFNEMVALEKELSQTANGTTNDFTVTRSVIVEPLKEATDLAKLKQILESDEEALHVPKLTNLSRNALTTTPPLSETSSQLSEPPPAVPTIRELSVEEELAEMCGVPSDPEDFDELDKNNMDIEEVDGIELVTGVASTVSTRGGQQDVLLINLAEIFDTTSDLYVVQCDMNENILGVVTSDQDGNEASGEHSEDTLQLIELLTEEPQETQSQMQDDIMESEPILPDYVHHEEIVHEDNKIFERCQFLKYMHNKYAQTSINRYYHTQRIIKKYRRLCKRQKKRIVKGS